MIFILQTVWLFIAELSGKGLDFELVFKFLLYKMPSVVPLVIPLSVLLSSIMTFGDFAENYEFAAMKSAGISLNRALKNLSIFMIFFSIGAFFFANNVIPYADYKFVNLRKNIAQKKPAMAIAEGQFSTIGPYSIKVDKKSGEEGNTLTGVTIHQKSPEGEGNKIVIKAKSGQLYGNDKSNLLKLKLFNGYYYEDIIPKKYEDRNKLPFAKASFKTDIINIDLAKLNDVDLNDESVTNSESMLNVSELNYTIDSLSKNVKKELISFSDNMYPRTGIINVNSKVKFKNKSNDLLYKYDDSKKVEILNSALSNVESNIFFLEGAKLTYDYGNKNINEHYISLYDKFVISFSCILMFFIGAPLGAIIRKGGLGLPIVFAVLIFIFFHFVNTFGKKVAQENGIPPFLGCWLSTFLLLPLSVLLTYRATNDSGLINFDGILTPIQKIFEKIKPKASLFYPIIDLSNYNISDDEDWNKLNQQSNEVLINAVKNAKQFKYSNDYRTKALIILEKRGITQESLLETNDLNNLEYSKIETQINEYHFYSRITFFIYLLSILGSLVFNNNKSAVFIIIILLIFIIIFYISLYFSQKKLQEIEVILNKKIGSGITVSFLVGFPFFIFVYFHNYNMLKEAIAEYR